MRRKWAFPASLGADLGVAVLYAAIALALLAPLASVIVMPDIPDTVGHVGFLAQARLALEEGQFPLRVAPWEHSGLRYPSFQFYGQLPDTLGGLLYRFVTPANPYQSVQLLIFLAFTGGAFGMYLLCRRLTDRPLAALLAGAAYLLSPYVIVNVTGRGALTESCAQGLLPLVAWLSVRAVDRPGLATFLWAAVAWFALAATHLITFLYLPLFLGPLLLWLAWSRRAWRGLLTLAGAVVLGLLLAAYYLVPIVATTELRIRELLGRPADWSWLTQLPTLLSLASVAAEPSPGRGVLPANMNPAAGWVLLAGWAVTAWARLGPAAVFWPGDGPLDRARWRALADPLLVLFAVALFLTWSPLDFWSRLPPEFSVVQFPYRFYAQVDWLGALLVGLAAWALFGTGLGPRHAVVAVLLFGALSASYVPTLRSSKTTVADVIARPSLGYGNRDYLYVSPLPVVWGGEDLPLVGDDDFLKSEAVATVPASLGPAVTLHLVGTAREDWFPDGVRLAVERDGVPFATRQVGPGDFSWDVPLPTADEPYQLRIGSSETRIPHELDPNNADRRSLSIKLRELRLVGTPPEATVVPLGEVSPALRDRGPVRELEVVMRADRELLQLPILYYPGLLDVRVDGAPAAYFPSQRGDLSVATVRLPPGPHHISMAFTGSSVGNLVSVLAWSGMLLAGLWVVGRLLARRLRPRRGPAATA